MNKKYSEDIDKIKKKTVSYNSPEVDQKMKNQIKGVFKLTKITIPMKFKVDL